MRHRWKSFCLALLILAVGGWARLPMEQSYTSGMRKAKLLEAPLNLSMRDELGQSFFIAVLGGFRSVVASLVELKTIRPWQQSNWGIVDQYYSICTRLQPREAHYWESRAWHLAANARDYYLFDEMLTKTAREFKAQEYVVAGLKVLDEGLSYLPDNWKLWDRKAFYLSNPWNQDPDYAGAAKSYDKAASSPGGLPFLRRLAVYELAKVPGCEAKAWDRLIALYNSGDSQDRTTTVEVEILRLHFQVFRNDPARPVPRELYRLITPELSQLTEAEKKHSDFLLKLYDRRVNPNRPKPRPPQVDSPNVPRER